MAISYNTGTTASADTSASVNITIPSGVLVNDVMLMSLEVFTEDASAPTVSFSGGGGGWTLITPTDASANPQVATFGSSIWSYGYAYYRVATAGDPGATLTVSESGSAAGTTWFAVALASYTGASTSAPIDVAGGANARGAYGTTVTCPSETTGVTGDWAVYLGPCGPAVGSVIHGPAGSTQRQAVVSDAGIGAAINDSNGSVGNSGTGIGGGTFSATSGSGNVWWEAFTVGLAPPGAGSPAPFHPAVQALRAKLPQQPLLRGRTASAKGAPVRNPVPGPVFYQATSPCRARIPQNRPGGFYNGFGTDSTQASGKIMWSPGAPVQNPAPGPVFFQRRSPVRFILPPWHPTAGRIGFNKGAAVQNPIHGPPAYPLQGPVRVRLPQLQPRAGRVYSNAGAPVRNPAPGPVFTQKTSPVQARHPLPARGRVYSFAPPEIIPLSSGPVFVQADQALRARLPQQPLLRGRISSGAGAPVHNPKPGPVFIQAVHPAQARIPQVFSKGRVSASKGAAVQNPNPGPVFRQATSPARIRITLPLRGRVASNIGAPVFISTIGPKFYPADSPIRARIPQNAPRGRVSSNSGAPVHNPASGAVFHPRVTPVRVVIPQVFSKGRVSSNPGGPVLIPGTSPKVYPLQRPVRAQQAPPPRGRIGSNPGGPVFIPASGPKVYPAKGPVQARRPLPPRGRITLGNKAAPVRNPVPGPVFYQAVKPIRVVIPQNAPRGRTSSNPGGPVENIPFATLRFRTGTPYFQWATGTPGFQWSTGMPEAG